MSGTAQVVIHGLIPNELLISMNKTDYMYSSAHSLWKAEAESTHQTSSWSWSKLPVPAPSDLCVN